MMVNQLREYSPQQALLDAFDLARSPHQYHCKKRCQVNHKDEILKEKVQRFYDSRGSAGSRTISGALKQQGEPVGRYKTRRLMKALGLVSQQK